MRENVKNVIYHSAINALPFMVIYFISPYIKYQDYEFLYLLSHRKFWYIWIIPLLLIFLKRYRVAHFFTVYTTVAMLLAQYFGDIRYRQELIRAKNGNYYPHANHFGLWLKYTLLFSFAIFAIHLFINRKMIAGRIKQFKNWWNCR